MSGVASVRRSIDAGIALILAGGGIAALGFYTSLLPWKLGVWTDTEPMVLALHGGAVFCAMGLLSCAWARPWMLSWVFSHPIVLAALFVAGWSMVAALFVTYPVLSLLGSPQLGEGALYFADVSIFVAAGILLRRLSRPRRVFVVFALAVCVATPLFVKATGVFDWGPSWRLFKFDDYLAYYAVAGAMLVLALPGLRSGWRVLAAASVALPGLSVSSNLTAIIIVVCVALPAGALLHVLLARSVVSPRGCRFAAAAAVPLLASSGVFVVWLIGQSGVVPSLTSRLFMYQTLLPVVIEQPMVLAVGQGWGQVNAAVLAHLTESGATIWDGSWDLAIRDIPHSHNFAVEALSGAGLPAMLGTIVLLMALPATARRDVLPVVAFAAIALAGMGAMWFQLPATVGLGAISLGLLAGSPGLRFKVPHTACVAILVAIVVLQAAALVWLSGYGVSARQAMEAEYRVPDNADCGWFPADGIRGDIGLAQAFGAEYDGAFKALASAEAISSDHWDRLGRLYCVVSRRLHGSRSIRLLLADQLFRARIAQDPNLKTEAYRFATAMVDWEASLKRFLDVVPGRTDIAAPYLSWRLSRGEPKMAIRFAEVLLSRNAEDPVGNWFLGAAMAAASGGVTGPYEEKILSHMRRALSMGIERYIKVDPVVTRFIVNR